MIGVVVSPLCMIWLVFVFILFVFLHVGEIHRRGDSYTLVLPSVCFCFVFFLFMFLHVGEIHREEMYFKYSRSPLYEPVFWTRFVFKYSDDGEIHRRKKLYTLVLPSDFYRFMHFGIFADLTKWGPTVHVWYIIGGRVPLYYIYIV